MWLDPALTLHGSLVYLEPLAEHHIDDLFTIAQDEDIWRYLVFDTPRERADMARFVHLALSLRDQDTVVPFVIRTVDSGEIIGSTRFMEIVAGDRVAEIGWTWFGRPHWRSGANVESKYLLLQYAFETAQAIRIQIKTDLRNTRSQAAIEKLGAVREGILRNHRIVKDGYRRSSVVFSILEEEWPSVKSRLDERLAGYRSGNKPSQG